MQKKYMPITANLNKQNHLEIGGVDTIALTKEFGTPLYVICEKTLRNMCQTYINSFSKIYPSFEAIYASKALSNLAIMQIVSEEGLGLDVVSGGELHTALAAGFDPQNIYFHGNNKSPNEIKEATIANIGRFIIDNTYELDILNKLSQELNQEVSVTFRITPEVEAHTHEFIQTGQIDSKFGINKDAIVDVIRSALSMPKIKVKGIHAHIGSQIFDTEPYHAATEIILNHVLEIKEKDNIMLEEINIGGGLGIPYTEKDDPKETNEFAIEIVKTIKDFCKKNNLPLPKLIIEPGRSIVATAGITLYTVGSTKNIPNIRTYISIDGGMADNPRPITYGSKYEACIANKFNQENKVKYTIAGKYCESGDILIKDINLPITESGDILSVFATGAYNYSMASNYNRVTRPAMVLVNNGTSKLIVKRETYQDLIRNDLKIG